MYRVGVASYVSGGSGSCAVFLFSLILIFLHKTISRKTLFRRLQTYGQSPQLRRRYLERKRQYYYGGMDRHGMHEPSYGLYFRTSGEIFLSYDKGNGRVCDKSYHQRERRIKPPKYLFITLMPPASWSEFSMFRSSSSTSVCIFR